MVTAGLYLVDCNVFIYFLSFCKVFMKLKPAVSQFNLLSETDCIAFMTVQLSLASCFPHLHV